MEAARKRKVSLQYANRRQTEVDRALSFFDAHKFSVPSLWRDSAYCPPRDTEGYFASDISESDPLLVFSIIRSISRENNRKHSIGKGQPN
jgi:hypothetical protein